jgi:cell division septum initiation protein DivIVA
VQENPSEGERTLPHVSKEPFRRTLRGYDPEEVEAAIEARDARLARLEREAQRLAERVVEREKRLQEALRHPMTVAVTNGIEELYGQARRQATRIRMKALDDAVQISDRVTELSKLRDDLTARVTELADVARARLGMEVEAAAEGIYAGEVEVEVGPLADFAQLAGFEDAAAKIRGASEIKVKRFSEGRATVSMNLSDPVELLRELEERTPFEFVVRDLRRGGIVLDVDEPEQQDRAA